MSIASQRSFRKAYIYGLFDPITNACRYVGKTNNPKKRLQGHLSNAKTRRTPVALWMKDLLVHGYHPRIVVLHECHHENWAEWEIDYITRYRASGCDLLNLAPGGEQPYCDYETRAKNGRANAIKRDSTPFKKRVNFLKRNIGMALKRGHLPPAYKHVLRHVARRRPDLFGIWANL